DPIKLDKRLILEKVDYSSDPECESFGRLRLSFRPLWATETDEKQPEFVLFSFFIDPPPNLEATILDPIRAKIKEEANRVNQLREARNKKSQASWALTEALR
ncbi:MAG: hypothetical protein LWX11_10700, partial [Firmicutes bacterium]|nr:hypothetical protein [Bacillota bacterium]